MAGDERAQTTASELCLPLLTKMRGKHERSSPRQVMQLSFLPVGILQRSPTHPALDEPYPGQGPGAVPDSSLCGG